MHPRDPLDYRTRANKCAHAGFKIQSTVWTIAADMCRAAVWSDYFGVEEAEALVTVYCQDKRAGTSVPAHRAIPDVSLWGRAAANPTLSAGHGTRSTSTSGDRD
jgi:hypothetical protein